MSYGYGGRNPFDQRDDSGGAGYGAPARGPPQASFGQGPRPGAGGGGAGGGGRYNQGPSMGRDDYGGGNVEMAPLAQNAGSFGGGDPNAILNECRSIDQGIDRIEENLNSLRMLQDKSLNEADSAGSRTLGQLDNLSSQTMDMYKQLTERVRQVKSQREAQQPKNAPQVGRVDRRLKQAIQQFQQVDSSFRKKTQDQMARQYRIVRPDASESEVRAVVEDSSASGQVFQQAMMQSNRRGQAQAVLSAVRDRHEQLKKIEQQMIELAQLFQDMDTLIVQQDVQVTQIEQKGEEVVENLDKGNEEIAVAVTTARKTRKKKWICLGICVAIVVIIAIVVAVYVLMQQKNNQKRSVQVRGIEWAGEAPVAAVYAQSKIVVPKSGSDDIPLARFAGALKTKREDESLLEELEKDPSATVIARYVVNTDFNGNDDDDSLLKRAANLRIGGRIGVPVPNGP